MINHKTAILTLLKTREQATTNEVCQELHLERHTVTKYLEALKAESLVEYKEIGRTKLWSINKAPFISVINNDNQISESFKELLNNLDEKIYLVSKDKEILWTNNKVKELKGKKCFENFNETESCKDCPAEKSFQSGKKEMFSKEFENKSLHVSTIPIKDINDQTVAFLELVK